jgi:hypothetical protein
MAGRPSIELAQENKVAAGKCSLPSSGHSAQLLATFQGLGDQRVGTVGMDVREKGLELAADSLQVGMHRGRLDMVAHVHNEETKCLKGWHECEFRGRTEMEVRMDSGCV